MRGDIYRFFHFPSGQDFSEWSSASHQWIEQKPILVLGDPGKFASLFKWQLEMKVTVSLIFSGLMNGDGEFLVSGGYVFWGRCDSA